MEKSICLLLIKFVFITNLFGQWFGFKPNLNDTFAISKILVTGKQQVVGLGFKMYIQDKQLDFPQEDSLYLFKSSDGGEIWNSQKIYFGQMAYPTCISSPSQDVIFIGGVTNFFSKSKVIKTLDNGLSWNLVNTPAGLINNYINFLNFYSENTGVLLGDSDGIEFVVYHTTDGGNSWESLLPDNIPDPILSEFSTASQAMEDHLWFTTNYGRIFKSSDRGYHWEVYQSILNNLEGISFSDTLNGIGLYGFVTLDFSTSPIIITSDGGHTWKQLDITPLGPKTGIFGACYIPNSSYIMLTTAKNSLLTGVFETWISPDRGETWQQISSGENIYTIHFLDAETGWGGEGQQFDHPTRMFKYTGSPLVGLFNDKKLSVNWSVFPNPSAGRVQVRVQEENPGPFLVLVNDLQGKLLLRKEWGGIGLLDLDLGSAAPGAYVVTLSSAKGKATSTVFVE